jgi:hypothetical protein
VFATILLSEKGGLYHAGYFKKIKQEPTRAAAPNQGAAASFYSTETEHFCRGDGQCAISKTIEEYLLLPKKILSKSLAKHPLALCNKDRGGN